MIVTLIEEHISPMKGVPIVLILRHNSFINELDKRHLTINSDDNHASKRERVRTISFNAEIGRLIRTYSVNAGFVGWAGSRACAAVKFIANRYQHRSHYRKRDLPGINIFP